MKIFPSDPAMKDMSFEPRTSCREVRHARLFLWRRPLLRAVFVATTAVVLAISGCKNDNVTPAASAPLQPVPAPAGHVADVFVPTPDATWQQMRTKIGGPMALLPATFPGAVVTMLGLTPQLLEQIDANVPALGVMTDDGKRLTMVMGAHVRDGARTVTLLTEGADAKYTARVDPSGVTVLDPKPTNTARAAALGVAGNYLLSGETADDLIRCGPYVSRTLPTRPAEKGHVVVVAPRAALAGPLVKRIRDGWASMRKDKEEQDKKDREAHGGKAPDFGDPSAALADVDTKVNRLADLLGDLETARATLGLDASGVHLRLDLTPAAGGGPASQEFAAMVTGDMAPLLSLPRSTVFGMVLRDSAPIRQQSATDQARSIASILGERIAPADTEKLEQALELWAKGRGDWLSASLDATTDGKVFVVQGAVADQKQLDSAIRAILGLVSVPAFQAPIEHHFGKVTVGKPAAVEGAQVVRVKREQKAKDGKPDRSEFDVAWNVSEKDASFSLVVSQDAKSWYKQRRADPDQSIAARPDLSAMLTALGNDVAFGVLVEPMRLVTSVTMRAPKVEAPPAPMVFAYGGNRSAAWFRIDMADDAAREVVKMLSRR